MNLANSRNLSVGFSLELVPRVFCHQFLEFSGGFFWFDKDEALGLVFNCRCPNKWRDAIHQIGIHSNLESYIFSKRSVYNRCSQKILPTLIISHAPSLGKICLKKKTLAKSKHPPGRNDESWTTPVSGRRQGPTPFS